MLATASAVFVLAFAANPVPAPTGAAAELASVQRVHADLKKAPTAGKERQRADAQADLARLVDAVVGRDPSGMAARDAFAYKLLSLGYSPRETADVVSERISKDAIDQAHTLRMVGRSREAADYLERQYRLLTPPLVAPTAAVHVTSLVGVTASPRVALPARPMASRPVLPPPPAITPRTRPVAAATTAPARPLSAHIGQAVAKYARLHGVDAALVHAIIAEESAYAAGARSSAGAIGLMQLMPATARALGVNPRIPEENIEGGVRYLAQMLKLFGRVELALVAYNAGPAFAERYARGETALYAETSAYLKQVLARLR